MYDKEWFEEEVKPQLNGFEFVYTFLKNEDDGNEFIDRIEFDGKGFGCEILFYSNGRLDMFVFNYKDDSILLNKILLKDGIESKKELFKELFVILRNSNYDNGM